MLLSIANGQIGFGSVSFPGIVVAINAEQDVTIINAIVAWRAYRS